MAESEVSAEGMAHAFKDRAENFCMRCLAASISAYDGVKILSK